MQNENNNITLLCKVVDNYGDIGFVYRLSRSLHRLNPNAHLRLVVSNLESFSSMANGIDPAKPHQFFSGWEVFDWNNSQVCKNAFTETPPKIILECFQCGRPEWLEEILFTKDRTQTVHIVNVEYLTAEEWADEFHLLKGATRSQFVKKMNFMPGLTPKTGGLVLDEPFMTYLRERNSALECVSKILPQEQVALLNDRNNFSILFFSYLQNCQPLVEAIQEFQEERRRTNPEFTVTVFAANGMSFEPFSSAHRNLTQTNASVFQTNAPVFQTNAPDPKTSSQSQDRQSQDQQPQDHQPQDQQPLAQTKEHPKTFRLVKLPYLQQDSWDALLTLTDFNFIRGEDSFSRACLSAIPFAWHVYVQDEEFQLVKLDAFLNRMDPFLSPQHSALLKQFSFLYNRTNAPMGEEATEAWNKIFPAASQTPGAFDSPQYNQQKKQTLKELLANSDALNAAFKNFSLHLQNNGDLAQHLLDYIATIRD